MLLAAVVGSGIMGERLAGGNAAIALLANALATGAGLFALILMLGPISGAHFNPAVTLADASQGGLAWSDVPVYIIAQVGGAFAGAAAAHVMFELPLFPSLVAVILAVPAPAPVTSPVFDTVAATELSVPHVIVRPVSG